MLQSFHLSSSLFLSCLHNTRLKPTHVLIHRPPVDGANEALREKLTHRGICRHLLSFFSQNLRRLITTSNRVGIHRQHQPVRIASYSKHALCLIFDDLVRYVFALNVFKRWRKPVWSARFGRGSAFLAACSLARSW